MKSLFCEILTSWQLVPCHGCTTPHWFCTQIITIFQFSWIWVKLLIKLIPKSIQIHIYPKQTWLISRGNLLIYVRIVFLKIFVYITNGELHVHPWQGTVANLWGWHKDFTEFNENFEKIISLEWIIHFCPNFECSLLKNILHLPEFIFFSEYSVLFNLYLKMVFQYFECIH